MSLDTARQEAINAIVAADDYAETITDPCKKRECSIQKATKVIDALIAMMKQGVVQVNTSTGTGSMT